MNDKRTQDDPQAESRRILGRMAEESTSSGLAHRAQNHLAAADVDANDPIEKWGTRIGRTIAACVLLFMIAWAVLFVLGYV